MNVRLRLGSKSIGFIVIMKAIGNLIMDCGRRILCRLPALKLPKIYNKSAECICGYSGSHSSASEETHGAFPASTLKGT